MRRALLVLLIFSLFASCSPVQPAERLTVITHPDGPLYAGDQVSFEILPPEAEANKTGSVSVTFQGRELGEADIAPYGLGARSEAVLWWVWDTRNLKPGKYNLTFTLLPDSITETDTFRLYSADQIPQPEPAATWVTTTSACCIFHYISGTAAERDISSLSMVADEESAIVSEQIGSTLNTPIDVVFMSRVIGQGGFTSDSVYVSYLDDNYIGNDMAILFHHEFVHYYDAIRGGVFRPSIFQEGLAVYLSGGHFKLEPLIPRAAAMVDLGWYIPLTNLANDFYNQQHDTGYLEAAGLVEYLVETYGWDAFNEFYRDIPNPENGQTTAMVIDTALHKYFNISFTDLESKYISFLQAQTIQETVRTDLELTVSFYDTARRYQQMLDPSAYYLTAWLPNGSEMRQRGIVADFLRRPRNWDNQVIEVFLIHAHSQFFGGDYPGAENTLKLTNLLMDEIAH
jgi:hypothetical protein